MENTIQPMITYGTNPGMGMSISNGIPNAKSQEGGVKTYLKSLRVYELQRGRKYVG